MSPGPWRDDWSPETTPIRLRAHATTMMKTPDRRRANAVEMRIARNTEGAWDAMMQMSLSLIRFSTARVYYARRGFRACGAPQRARLDRHRGKRGHRSVDRP